MGQPFLVSARKHRPLRFSDVLGQTHITRTLQHAIERNQLAQAFLFCGPRGVGKTTCARILAHEINATTQKKGEAPSSLNIFELDAASNNSVEDIRNLIDQVRFPPQEGQYKVYIIDEVHMLSQQAFNAFLKTLEEPPAYALFILATTEKHKVIPTILSRCQIFDFRRISVEDTVEHLKTIMKTENVVADEDCLYMIARRSEGSLRDALSLYDMLVTLSPDKQLLWKNVSEVLYLLDHNFYFQLIQHLAQKACAEALLMLDSVLQKGVDLVSFLRDLSEQLRHLLMAQSPETLSLLPFAKDVRIKYAQLAKTLSSSFLLKSLELCATCEQGYKQAKNARLWVELTLFRVSEATEDKTPKSSDNPPQEITDAKPAEKKNHSLSQN